MVSIKDYAASHGVSYEAVRRQIARYSGREMDGFRISDHIIKVNRTQYLDDEATAFLDARRAQNPVVVQQEQRDETIERLRAEVDRLQKRLIAAQDEYRVLLQDKHEIELREQKLLADKDAIDGIKAAAEEAIARAEKSEEARHLAEEAAKAAQEEAERVRKAAEEASASAAEAQERISKMESAGLMARIFRSW
ncbi:MAG: hypothetical protein J6E40_12345 [Lachnospiraceae bacterium]|nr:hypothetical protein [Lachnospiraceae bacterium]MBP3900837.1 hypothetical protein [Blautia sp.]